MHGMARWLFFSAAQDGLRASIYLILSVYVLLAQHTNIMQSMMATSKQAKRARVLTRKAQRW